MRGSKNRIRKQVKLAHEFGPAYTDFATRWSSSSAAEESRRKLYQDLVQQIAKLELNQVISYATANPRAAYASAKYFARKKKLDLVIKIFSDRILVRRVPNDWWQLMSQIGTG